MLDFTLVYEASGRRGSSYDLPKRRMWAQARHGVGRTAGLTYRETKRREKGLAIRSKGLAWRKPSLYFGETVCSERRPSSWRGNGNVSDQAKSVNPGEESARVTPKSCPVADDATAVSKAEACVFAKLLETARLFESSECKSR